MKLKDDFEKLDTEFVTEGNKLRGNIASMAEERDNREKEQVELEAKVGLLLHTISGFIIDTILCTIL